MRKYLVDADAFDPRLAEILKKVPSDKEMLRKMIRVGDLPMFLSQVLSYASMLKIDIVDEVAQKLDVKKIPPLWCYGGLVQKLQHKSNLFDFLEEVLNDMYSTKYIGAIDVEPPVSLLYLQQVQELKDKDIGENDYPGDAIFRERRKKKFIEDILKRDATLQREELEAKTLYEISTMLCALKKIKSSPKTPNSVTLTKAMDGARMKSTPALRYLTTLKKSKKLLSNAKDIDVFAREMNEVQVSVGSLPTTVDEVEPDTYYIGNNTLDDDQNFFIDVENVDWRMLRKKLKQGYRIVLQGQDGVLLLNQSRRESQPEFNAEQCKVFRGLKKLGVAEVTVKNWENDLVTNSPLGLMNMFSCT